MKYFSTFSGIGGFEIGIQNAWRTHLQKIGGGEKDSQGVDGEGDRLHAVPGKSTDPKSGRADEHTNGIPDSGQPTCVGFSEIDQYAIKVYEKRFEGVKNYGDITKIKAEALPDFDILVGGFPCQAFSIAKKRGGFEDTRGTMFFELTRILRAKQPRLFVFENVKNLLSHDSGRTFKTIISTVDELRYDIQWQVINSKNFAVPQNRERVLLVGHLRGQPRPQVFPISTANDTFVERLNTPVHSTDRIYSPEGISPTLSTMQGGGRQPYIAFSGDEVTGHQKTDSPRVRKASGVSGQLDRISDTQRYKMAGNAVTTNVIQAVFEKIFKESI